MPDSLSVLEADRRKLLEEFWGLGDLRPGSITAVVRRCGKPTCHCAKYMNHAERDNMLHTSSFPLLQAFQNHK
jgi:hypothetical protein